MLNSVPSIKDKDLQQQRHEREAAEERNVSPEMGQTKGSGSSHSTHAKRLLGQSRPERYEDNFMRSSCPAIKCLKLSSCPSTPCARVGQGADCSVLFKCPSQHIPFTEPESFTGGEVFLDKA